MLPLTQPLNIWHPTAHYTKYAYYHSPTQHSLFIRRDNSFTSHPQQPNKTFSPADTSAFLPSDALPADIREGGSYELWILSLASTLEWRSDPTTFKEYLRTLLYHEQRVMGTIRLPINDGSSLVADIVDGAINIYLVIDGLV